MDGATLLPPASTEGGGGGGGDVRTASHVFPPAPADAFAEEIAGEVALDQQQESGPQDPRSVLESYSDADLEAAAAEYGVFSWSDRDDLVHKLLVTAGYQDDEPEDGSAPQEGGPATSDSMPTQP